MLKGFTADERFHPFIEMVSRSNEQGIKPIGPVSQSEGCLGAVAPQLVVTKKKLVSISYGGFRFVLPSLFMDIRKTLR